MLVILSLGGPKHIYNNSLEIDEKKQKRVWYFVRAVIGRQTVHYYCY